MYTKAFPVIQEKFRLFGYDWMGNCFGLSADQRTMGEVLIFEIGTGKILTTGIAFADFVSMELVQNIEACLTSFPIHLLRAGIPPRFMI